MQYSLSDYTKLGIPEDKARLYFERGLSPKEALAEWEKDKALIEEKKRKAEEEKKKKQQKTPPPPRHHSM
jgi:hypothetical protein